MANKHFMAHLIENIECVFSILFCALLIVVNYFLIQFPYSDMVLIAVGAVAVILGVKDIATIIFDEQHFIWKVLGVLSCLFFFFIAAVYFAGVYGISLPIPEMSLLIKWIILPAALIVIDIFWILHNWFSQ